MRAASKSTSQPCVYQHTRSTCRYFHQGVTYRAVSAFEKPAWDEDDSLKKKPELINSLLSGSVECIYYCFVMSKSQGVCTYAYSKD
jgi:hypothetical protein